MTLPSPCVFNVRTLADFMHAPYCLSLQCSCWVRFQYLEHIPMPLQDRSAAMHDLWSAIQKLAEHLHHHVSLAMPLALDVLSHPTTGCPTMSSTRRCQTAISSWLRCFQCCKQHSTGGSRLCSCLAFFP